MIVFRIITYRVFCCSGSFRSHRSSNKNTVLPISSLIYKRDAFWSSSSKKNNINGNTSWIFPTRINNRTFFNWSTESGIRMCCWCLGSSGPLLALPIDDLYKYDYLENAVSINTETSAVNNSDNEILLQHHH